jgi:transposase-like protein
VTARGSTVIRRRIERVYKRTTGRHGPYGAYAWFARQIGVSQNTVYSWVNVKNPRMPRTAVLILLQKMEENAPPEPED